VVRRFSEGNITSIAPISDMKVPLVIDSSRSGRVARQTMAASADAATT